MSTSTFASALISEKVTLFELSNGQRQVVWFSHSARVYRVNFDALYSWVDEPAFLADLSAQVISTAIGYVASDAAPLLQLASIAEVEATELSFFYNAATRDLYVYIQDGERPSLHLLVIGVVYGAANRDIKINNTHYEARLESAPAITQTRDAMFWGCVVTGGGGTFVLNNRPAPGQAAGPFDTIGENIYIFNSYARMLVGLVGDAYTDFKQVMAAYVDKLSVNDEKCTVVMSDPRAKMNRKLPLSVFDKTEYPDLADGSIGTGISIGYGVMKKVPVVCTNEAKAPAPATYNFKLFDSGVGSPHPLGIKAITTVYVEGVVKAAAATDLVEATFTLAAANYSPGDEVLVDCSGYVDAAGDLIENAIDVLQDILVTWLGYAYIPAVFNVLAWDALRVMTPAVALFAQEQEEAITIMGDVAFSARVYFTVQRDNRLTVRKRNKYQVPMQALALDDLLEIPTVEYNSEEAIASTMVGYSKRWGEDEYQWLLDTSREAEVFLKFGTYPNDKKKFPTLLTSEADAQVFSDDVLDEGNNTAKNFDVVLKTQAIDREVVDVIQAPARRRNGSPILGDVVAEIMATKFDPLKYRETLSLRFMREIPQTMYVQGGWYGVGWYGDDGYGDSWYARTENQEVG
jgi:hypothetical protein